MATIFIAMHPFVYSTGLHQTGIRGIQDTRQFVDSNTSDIENDDNLTLISKPGTSSVRHPWIHRHKF